MLLLTLLLAGSACVYAQKKEVKIFEEATARRIEPQVHVFITPQVADLKMLSTEREQYGPYRFEMKSLETHRSTISTAGKSAHYTVPLWKTMPMPSSSRCSTAMCSRKTRKPWSSNSRDSR